MPTSFYEERIGVLQTEQQQLLKKKRAFGILRLGNIAVLVAALYFLWNIAWWPPLLAAVTLFVIFAKLVYKDLANQEALDANRRLIEINETELQSLQGNYYKFSDGRDYLSKEHAYAIDLDIFGHASLFQYTNRTVSEPGADILANWLLHPAETDQIFKRQEASKELSTKPLWMQWLRAYGHEHPIRNNTVQNFENWLQQPTLFLQFRHWQWIRYLLPVFAISITGLVIFSYLPLSALYTALFIMGVVAFQVNKVLAPVHNQVSRMVDEMETFSASIAHIEKEHFGTPLLLELQQAFIPANNITASQNISRLKNILEKLDLRYNLVMAAPLNLLLQWNLQQVLELEKWKTENKETVLQWFDALANFEAINSFAYLRFNHPQWGIPLIHDKHFFIKAKELGHPLIIENRRVNNFIDIENNNSIMLVTGSNMAGKSTYLRSVGINVVLAMAGAPVCAQSFELSPVQLLSSMRITDNLEESTSTFYAELKKLKAIIDKVNRGEKVFILLDEILRGTNSLDRHTGSVALIKQLIRHHAPAIIATHDIALAALQTEFQQNIYNFHFDVQVNNEELYFDYKLKPGVCQSLNASVLMKKIGIEGV